MGYKYIVPDIAPSMERQFQRVLEKQKMKFMLRTKVANVDTSGDIVKLTLEPAASGEQNILKADFVPVPTGVWAIDEVIPGSMLTHKTEEDEVACVEVIAGKEGHVDYDMVCRVVYMHPEIVFC